MVGHLMEREPYWDYMSRRMREEKLVPDEMYKNEIAQMQKQIHDLQVRVIELVSEVQDLKKYEPVQLELFDAHI
tara:strand:+ start:182 stop:403 length:222 start_codon:yes stop_codon:yes gene_type:complete